jgi:hypothetical protein
MPQLPEPNSFILSEAIKWIKKTSDSTSIQETAHSLYWALYDGNVTAHADIEDFDGNILDINQIIPREEWENISLSEFCERWAENKFHKKSIKGSMPFEKRYYTNICIERKNLRSWLFPKKIESRALDRSKCHSKLILQGPKKLKELGKETCFAEIKNEIPGLSRKQFLHVWAEIAKEHPEISQPGRKSKSSQ